MTVRVEFNISNGLKSLELNTAAMDENIGSPHFVRPPKETDSIRPELAKAG